MLLKQRPGHSRLKNCFHVLVEACSITFCFETVFIDGGHSQCIPELDRVMADPLEALVETLGKPSVDAAAKAGAVKRFNVEHTRALGLATVEPDPLWGDLGEPSRLMVVYKTAEKKQGGKFYALCDVAMAPDAQRVTATIRPIATFSWEGTVLVYAFDLVGVPVTIISKQANVAGVSSNVTVEPLRIPNTESVDASTLSLFGLESDDAFPNGAVASFGGASGENFHALAKASVPRPVGYMLSATMAGQVFFVTDAQKGGTPSLFISALQYVDDAELAVRAASTTFPLRGTAQVLAAQTPQGVQLTRKYATGVSLQDFQTMYLPWVVTISAALPAQLKEVTAGLQQEKNRQWRSGGLLPSEVLVNFASRLTNMTGTDSLTPSLSPLQTPVPAKVVMANSDASEVDVALANVLEGRIESSLYKEEASLVNLRALYAKYSAAMFITATSTGAQPVKKAFDAWAMFEAALNTSPFKNAVLLTRKRFGPLAIFKTMELTPEAVKAMYDGVAKYFNWSRATAVESRYPYEFLASQLGLLSTDINPSDVGTSPTSVAIVVWIHTLVHMNTADFAHYSSEWAHDYDGMSEALVDNWHKVNQEIGSVLEVSVHDELQFKGRYGPSPGWTSKNLPLIDNFRAFVGVVDYESSQQVPDYDEIVRSYLHWVDSATTKDVEILSDTNEWRDAVKKAKAVLARVAGGVQKVDELIRDRSPTAADRLLMAFGTTTAQQTKPSRGPAPATKPAVSRTATQSTAAAAAAAPTRVALPVQTGPERSMFAIPYSSEGLVRSLAVAIPKQAYSLALRLTSGGVIIGEYSFPMIYGSVFVGPRSPALFGHGRFVALSITPGRVRPGDDRAVAIPYLGRTLDNDSCDKDITVRFSLLEVGDASAPLLSDWERDPAAAHERTIASPSARNEFFAPASLRDSSAATAVGDARMNLFLGREVALAVMHTKDGAVLRGIYILAH